MNRPPLMRQTWRNLLFVHWPVPPELLRPYLPARLEIDTFEGQAWLGVVPFTMSGIRPLGLPAVPGLSQLHELNVRTYATLNGVPGVWFLSLDATNALGVWAARTFFHLPYLHADISLIENNGTLECTARRTHGGEARPLSAPSGRRARAYRWPAPAPWRTFSPSGIGSTPPVQIYSKG